MDKLKWAIGQLIPRTYWTIYRKGENEQHFVIWKMWLGRTYDTVDIEYRTEEGGVLVDAPEAHRLP